MKSLKQSLKNLDSKKDQGAQKGKHLRNQRRHFVSSKIHRMKGKQHQAEFQNPSTSCLFFLHSVLFYSSGLNP